MTKHFKEYAWKGCHELWHAGVSRPLLVIIRFRSVLAQFWALVANELSVIRVSGILRRPHWRNNMKFGMQVYHDHIQNWLNFDPILAIWWPKKTMKVGLGILAFYGDAWKDWSEIWHVGVSCSPSKFMGFFVTVWWLTCFGAFFT